MEANPSSMNNSGLSAVCTLSKSQIHLHSTHSGRVMDADAIQDSLMNTKSNRKRSRSIEPTQESPEGNQLLNTLIKDLRVKRVFPQTFTPSENVIKSGSKSGTQLGLAEPEEVSKETNIDGNGFGCFGPDGDSLESKEIEMSELGFMAESPILADAAPNLDEPPNGIQPNVHDKAKLVLVPRKRVFKAPGLYGYRRMLPYLKDISKDNSCMLDLCELPSRDKGLGRKAFQGELASANQLGAMHQVTSHRFFRECRTSDLEAVQVLSNESSNANELSSESPEYVHKLPPRVVVHQCLPKPSVVDGKNENFDKEFSCEVQKLYVPNPVYSSTVEDSQVNKVHVIDMQTVDCNPVENTDTAAKSDNVSSLEDKNVKDTSPQSASVMEYHCKEKTPNYLSEQKFSNAEGVSNAEAVSQTHDSNEESVQMTPPDTEILDKLEVKEISKAGCVHQSTKQGVFTKPSSGFNHRDATLVDVNHESSLKRKPVLNPCSRQKLFRTPDSVSYRRLLPFLIGKGSSINSHCANTDKDLEKGPQLTPSQKGTRLDESNGLRYHQDHQKVCSPCTLPISISKTGNSAAKDDVPNLMSLEHVTGLQMSFDQQKEKHFQSAVSGKQSKSEISPDSVVSSRDEKVLPISLQCPTIGESLAKKDGAVSVINPLSICPVQGSVSSRTTSSNGRKPVQAKLGLNSSEIDTTVSSGIKADVFRKGILKRNPRGCRGLCNCLNCASFRLHAERAFEFSRNQMQDAEEIAIDLMTELSNLRNILEKSAVTANGPIINLNEVKKACTKASVAEDIARTRLGEMNYDLKIHCRITCLHESRVTFANHIEEKVIPNADCSSN